MAGRLPGPPPVTAILDLALVLLASRAWQSMGLVVNPETGEVDRDLDESRRAIEAVEVLAGLVGPARVREIQPLLADLRLNFVKQAGDAAPAEEAE
ncbi:MAG: DUF1844 domain-containing protein [bacterium]|nr:DUF1844 domain-containing protein [bacterium]